MIEIKDIIKRANSLGACKIADAITDWRSGVRAMFSPQGREFCALHRFPDIEMMRAMPNISNYGVHVDAGEITIVSQGNICIAGRTDAKVYANINDKIHHIIVMHGAHVDVIADNYAVVDVIVIDGNVEVLSKNNAKVVVK